MRINFRKIFEQLLIVLVTICIGTVFDWFAHHLSPRFDVPDYYFRNKIIFGTLIGFIALRVFRMWVQSDRWLAFWSMLTVAILLQARYYLEGYDLTFVLLFMVIHFVVFFVPASFLFPRFHSSIRG